MIAIIDYKAGNLKSVERALKGLGFPCRITNEREEILESERVIFPGVGAAGSAMDDLEGSGVNRVLRDVFESGIPLMGICLGAQIIMEMSEENDTTCIGLIKGRVRRFESPLYEKGGERLKIPHMGWNGVRHNGTHPVLDGIGRDDEFYFVHSYYPMPALERHIIGRSEYGIEFPSVIGRKNLIATQFHPEKSAWPGLRILRNFCAWDGAYA